MMILSIEQLERLAMTDQGEDIKRPWSYTGRCHHCGGVKSFLDWIKKNPEEIIKLKNGDQ